jgi:hypothetical protein
MPLGAVFLSPTRIDPALAATVRRPSLVLINGSDADQSGSQVYGALTAAPTKKLTVLGGGTNSACNGIGYHVFYGIEAAFFSAIANFIDTYNDSLGATAAPAALAIEYRNASLDHYFLTHIAAEAAILDAGVAIKGWTRTGQAFNVYAAAQAGSSPVCRFYIPPGKGDSHFYGRGTAECDATGLKNPTFVDEDPQFFHVALPAAGICPGGTRPVYRTFSNRADANHRYMTDRVLRDQMVANGWLVEGDGPDFVVMCSPP